MEISWRNISYPNITKEKKKKKEEYEEKRFRDLKASDNGQDSIEKN